MTSAPTSLQPISEDERRAWLHLANLQLSPRRTNALLTHFHHNPQAIFAASDRELGEARALLERHVQRMRDPEFAVTARQWDWMQQSDTNLVCLCHDTYPRLLRDIPDPPPILFVRGHLEEADRFAVGMVGSRRASPYGRAVAQKFARELAGNGLVVVSGGALGVDTAAHQGALESGGRTMAILGCGLDVEYPRENQALFQQIARQGAVITEYPPGAQPENWRFPARNRVISGLSQGVLVVEAPESSGALITSRYAVEHGRIVMAVPGNIDRPGSAGTNNLLKDGATLVTEIGDILRALGMVALPARPEHQIPLELETDSPAATETPAASLPRPNQNLPPNQAKMLAALSLSPRHLDSIAEEAGLTAMQAGVEMTLLELTGLARRLPGNLYIRIL